jgi:hypothetical protein
LNHGKRIIPTITFGDGSFLVEPSNAALAQKLNLTTQDLHSFHDVTIIGAGPAGLTAAIYNARDGFSVMVIDEGALTGSTIAGAEPPPRKLVFSHALIFVAGFTFVFMVVFGVPAGFLGGALGKLADYEVDLNGSS